MTYYGTSLLLWLIDAHVLMNVVANDVISDDDVAETYEHYSTIVPKIIAGDADVLDQLVQEHINGIRPLNNIRSRCVNKRRALYNSVRDR